MVNETIFLTVKERFKLERREATNRYLVAVQ